MYVVSKGIYSQMNAPDYIEEKMNILASQLQRKRIETNRNENREKVRLQRL